MSLIEIVWQGLIMLAAGAGWVAACRKVVRTRPGLEFQEILKRGRHVYLAFPLLLALPTLNVSVAAHPDWQWEMPGWLQIHYAAISWGLVESILAYVFGFCGAAAFANDHKWKRELAVFAVVVLASVEVHAIWSSRPNLPPMDQPRFSKDGVILQTTAFTCVPTAAANIAALFGVHTTEKELATLFHTSRDGTYPGAVLAGLKEFGISGRKLTLREPDIESVKPPAMLFVLHDSHAVVYVGRTNGVLEIWNPSGGKVRIPEGRIGRIWDGHALEFWRAAR